MIEIALGILFLLAMFAVAITGGIIAMLLRELFKKE